MPFKELIHIILCAVICGIKKYNFLLMSFEFVVVSFSFLKFVSLARSLSAALFKPQFF